MAISRVTSGSMSLTCSSRSRRETRRYRRASRDVFRRELFDPRAVLRIEMRQERAANDHLIEIEQFGCRHGIEIESARTLCGDAMNRFDQRLQTATAKRAAFIEVIGERSRDAGVVVVNDADGRRVESLHPLLSRAFIIVRTFELLVTYRFGLKERLNHKDTKDTKRCLRVLCVFVVKRLSWRREFY